MIAHSRSQIHGIGSAPGQFRFILDAACVRRVARRDLVLEVVVDGARIVFDLVKVNMCTPLLTQHISVLSQKEPTTAAVTIS